MRSEAGRSCSETEKCDLGGADGGRARLGRALEKRYPEIERLLRERPSLDRRDEDLDASNLILATQVIARWLATGEYATGAEREELARSGERPFHGRTNLGTLTKAYLSWRDVTLGLLEEEAASLDIRPAVLDDVVRTVRRSCDASLVRMARHFDATRTYLEALVAEEHAKLVHLALHDPVTGLANRAYLLEHLDAVLSAPPAEPAGSAVLFIDLDDFKAVNDRYGHAVGDQVLTVIAGRLRATVRECDTVARFGGDEFVVLAPRLRSPRSQGQRLGRRLIEAFREPISVGEELLQVTASIGIAEARPGIARDEILSRADQAMYRAKRDGLCLVALDGAVPATQSRRQARPDKG